MTRDTATHMPWAWGIQFKDGKRATLLDYGRALQLAAYHGGHIVNLYQHPPPVPISPDDVATGTRNHQPPKDRP